MFALPKFCFCFIRRYHNYCVGLEEIPEGSWHCEECTYCFSCRVKENPRQPDAIQWAVEYKTGLSGNKVYSHTMCQLCHK